MRILITNDKDFGEIVFFQKKPTFGIVLFRIKGQNSLQKVELLKKLLIQYQEKIENHFVVITEKRFKFIPMKGVRE